MSKILVFGHQNPDSDAIGSSVAYAYLKRELGVDAEAVALGTPNEETAFALDYFGVEAPRVVESAKAEGADQVILTDHNEFQQSISDIRHGSDRSGLSPPCCTFCNSSHPLHTFRARWVSSFTRVQPIYREYSCYV